jgi:membrane protein implicated in regulation of membrane protease activity
MLNKIIFYLKKYLNYCTDRWWILQLLSIMLLVLSIIFRTLLLTQIGVLLIIASIIDQFIKNKWKIGLMLITIWLLIVGLAAYWLLTNLFPTREGTHKEFSERYEDRSEIQRIIGVGIPKFKITESKLIHYQDFDFEFEVQSKIVFETIPDLKFFNTLDSICSLPMPTKPNENSSFFYYGIENIQRCWSKDSINYKYIRSSDSRPKFLHSRDAYFIFEIKKGAKIAEIAFGNY